MDTRSPYIPTWFSGGLINQGILSMSHEYLVSLFVKEIKPDTWKCTFWTEKFKPNINFKTSRIIWRFAYFFIFRTGETITKLIIRTFCLHDIEIVKNELDLHFVKRNIISKFEIMSSKHFQVIARIRFVIRPPSFAVHH